MTSLAQGALIEQTESVVTNNSITYLFDVDTKTWVRFTGTDNQIVNLPDSTTLKVGRRFEISNRSTGIITVKLNDGQAVASVLQPFTDATFTIFDISSPNGVWDVTTSADVNEPLKLHASLSAPNVLLNISSNFVQTFNRSGRTTPPIDDVINLYPRTEINMQTGTVSGGTVLLNGGAFSLPTSSPGNYRRMAFVYRPMENVVDTTFSLDDPLFSNLQNPGYLFARLDGIRMGYIDLYATTSNTYRTASSISNIIEDTDIVTFVTSAGSSDPSNNAFKAQSLSSNVITLKRGFLILDDGKELVTNNGSNNVDLSFSLLSEVNSAGITSPLANTTYYLYIDLFNVTNISETVGDTSRVAYPVTKGITGPLTVLGTSPEYTNLGRYVPLCALKTDGSSNYVYFSDLARRRHQQTSAAVNPLLETIGPRSLGLPGLPLNEQRELIDGDFSVIANSRYYHFTGNAQDSSPAALHLLENGSPSYISPGLFGRTNVLTLNGATSYVYSNNAYFNPGDNHFLYFGHFDINWNTASPLIIQGNTTSDRSIYVRCAGNGQIEWSLTNSAGSWDFQNTINANLKDGIHFIAVHYNNTTNVARLYINNSIADETSIATIRSATSSFFALGYDGVNYTKGSIQEFGTVIGTLVTEDQVFSYAARRYTNTRQLATAHPLTSNSFPGSQTNNYTFWQLYLNGNDGTTNSINLTDNGTPDFTGRNAFGEIGAAVFDGSTRYFSSTSTFFNSKEMTFGGVISLDWTVAGTEAIMGNWNATANERAFLLERNGSQLVFSVSSNGTAVTSYNAPYTYLLNKTYHHVTVRVKGDNVRIALNGSIEILNTNIGSIFTPTSPRFNIGGSNNVASMLGRGHDFFFVRRALTDLEIKKLASARIDYANSLAAEDQIWSTYSGSENGSINTDVGSGWIIDKSRQKLYVNFSNYTIDGNPENPGLSFTTKLFAGELSIRAIPSRTFDVTFTSDPTGTIPHNLPSLPTAFAVLHDPLGNGEWVPLNPEDHIKATTSNLIVDTSLLTVSLSQPVRIVASSAVPPLAVSKEVLDNLTPSYKLVSTNYQAVNGDQLLVDTSGGAVTITLPASPQLGNRVSIYDAAGTFLTNNATVDRNGQLVQGSASNLDLDLNGVNVDLVYVSSGLGWRVYS